jgi:hypothetical protein
VILRRLEHCPIPVALRMGLGETRPRLHLVRPCRSGSAFMGTLPLGKVGVTVDSTSTRDELAGAATRGPHCLAEPSDADGTPFRR